MSSYETFFAIIQERMKSTRAQQFARCYDLAFALTELYKEIENDELKSGYRMLLDDVFHLIVDDCRIQHNMTREESNDCVKELSEYASIYSDDLTSYRYNSLKNLIEEHIRSYPPNSIGVEISPLARIEERYMSDEE